MKLARHIAYCFLLLMTASLIASAQEPSGKFTVNHATRWGTAILPAGSYSVSVHSGPVPYVLVTSDDRNAASIMAVASSRVNDGSVPVSTNVLPETAPAAARRGDPSAN